MNHRNLSIDAHGGQIGKHPNRVIVTIELIFEKWIYLCKIIKFCQDILNESKVITNLLRIISFSNKIMTLSTAQV